MAAIPRSPSMPARRRPQDGRTFVIFSCMLKLPETSLGLRRASANRPHQILTDSDVSTVLCGSRVAGLPTLADNAVASAASPSTHHGKGV